jgi:UDP-GlcNAc:undecaprenyl-phosphate/decaprenyl-phosphate GlcNAc-1-phosphate transferase
MSVQYISALIALLFCLGSLPLVKRLAEHFSLYDAPGPLKIHQQSIPRLGGIAMLVGFLAGTSVLYLRGSRPSSLPLLIIAIVCAVGLVDDIRTLGAWARFSIHIAAGCALWYAGWGLGWFSSPAWDLLVTCLFVAFVINAMNLLDGMDGLAASTAAIVSIGFLVISLNSDDALATVIASSLLGASLGMLSVNAPPAKMFMGDSGSTFIGIVLAFLSLEWVRAHSVSHSILVPLIFLGIPLADALLAVLRRTCAHQLLFQGDRRHYYDLLLLRGRSVDGVLRISMGITGILVFAGWLCSRGFIGVWLTCVSVLSSLAAGAYFLGSLKSDATTAQTNPQQESSLGPALE